MDVGARGNLDKPWSELPASTLKVIGFEPDENECNRLNAESQSQDRLYYPFALWSSETEVPIHLAKTPTCSSVHPPAIEDILKYSEPHWKNRMTEKIVSMKSKRLDSILGKDGQFVDFLKIDTQGAEFEILSGAGNALSENVFAVLVETWTTRVHKGQHLTGDILQLMDSHGFTLFDVGTAAAWTRSCSSLFPYSGKAQIIGLDLLFFNEQKLKTWLAEKKFARVVKAAAIVDTYGFPDFSYEILQWASSQFPERQSVLADLKAILVRDSSSRRKLLHKIRKGIGRVIRRPHEDFPSLHY
jgi:FkbM family methyltransferase